MVKFLGVLMAACFLVGGVVRAQGQVKEHATLNNEEEDKLRETQEPSARIELYVEFAQARLEQIDQFRQSPMDPRYENGAYLDRLVVQYIELTDELKNWIQDQYDRQGDMRRGLRKLLEQGPRQLEELRRIEQTPDAYAKSYSKSLHDAMDDLSDTLDGATKALGDQEKQLGELKRQEKVDTRAQKVRVKEEKKRAKEEKKLMKRERKQHPPTDEDQE